ncbi:MAG: hypothetical protein BGO83_18620 [Devosia sp. 66-14]|nr:MAG: hypothetical protein ABS47_10535 [Devosia sp. SCN 66-27]OJX22791.1 MAG: hypothetical protein BGO83_18620 [Devosia sp. 66-14]
MSIRKSASTLRAEAKLATTKLGVMKDKASLVATIVDLSLRALAPEVSMGPVPSNFLVVQDSKQFRVGDLSAARVSDLPAIPEFQWTGRHPLYMVSLTAPALCLSLYGASPKWVLTTVSFFCTQKSRRKLLDLEQRLSTRPRSYSHTMDEHAAPFRPAGSAFEDDHVTVPPTRRWKPLPPEYLKRPRSGVTRSHIATSYRFGAWRCGRSFGPRQRPQEMA